MKRDKVVFIVAPLIGATSLFTALMQGLGAVFVAYDITLGGFLVVVAIPILAAALAGASWYRRTYVSGLYLLAASIACLIQTIFGNGIVGIFPHNPVPLAGEGARLGDLPPIRSLCGGAARFALT